MRTLPPKALLAALLALAGCGAVGEITDDDGGGAEVLEGDASIEDAPGDDASITDDVAPRDAAEAGQGPDAEGTDATDAVARDAVDVVARDAVDVVARDAVDVVARDARAADVARDAVDVVARDARAADVALDGGCPEEMTLVGGRVCVDRWEAALEVAAMDGGVAPWSPYENPGTRVVRAVARAGVVPQGYITGEQSQRACMAAGKRLCALSEWLSACRGPMNLVYPYGNTYERRRCNEARTPHPVVQFFGTSSGVFTFTNMNNPGINMQPDSLARTGAFTGCVSPSGAWDMVGNLHEWIADPAGTFKGGFYVDAEINGRGCLYTTTAHAFSYRDYSTGFRCCADPR
jgi:sulfatase modifying factor 1